MNKKIIALAVAAACSAPAFADVTVYGRAHLSLDSNSGNAAATTTAGTKNGLNLASNASRLGFKGTEDLANGLKAVYQLETEVSGTGAASATNSTGLFVTQRDTYIGVAGGFGTVLAGRLPLANQYVGDANFFGDKVGDAGNLTAGGLGGIGLIAVPSRVSRAIAYASPNLGGASVLVGFAPNTIQSLTGTQNSLGKDSSFTLRASYDSNGLFAAASYLSLGVAGVGLTATPTIGVPGAAGIAKTGAKATILSLAAGYDFGVGKIRAQYVSTDLNAAAAFSAGATLTGAKQSVFALGGQFNLSENDAIKLQFAKAGEVSLSGNTSAGTGATLFALGYDHNLSKSTTVYAALSKVSNGTGAQFSATNYAHGGVGTPGVGKSPSALSVGVVRNF